MKNKIYLFLISALLASCAPTRFVKPLEEKQHAVNFSLGGPLVAYSGITIPIPLTTLSYGYGIKNNLTAFGSIHTTSLLFGVIQTDIGVVRNLMVQKNFCPGISITPAANLAMDIWQGHFKCWPQVDINAYWNYKQKRNFFYLGFFNWFELSAKKAFNEPQTTHWIFGPHIGHTFVRNKMDYNLEVKYIGPNLSNQDLVVHYKSPFDKGAMGVYFSITKKFGGSAKPAISGQ
jgi:hypothetical protein